MSEIQIPLDARETRVLVVANFNTIHSSEEISIALTIPTWSFKLIFIASFASVASLATVILIFVLIRRKFAKNKKREIELKAMLSTAKKETLISGSQFISPMTWEWFPDDSYSFCPLDKLPVTIDTSELCLSKKSDPLDINYWKEGNITVSSKKKGKAMSVSFLRQSLIEERCHIDIYAPKSPKFEVKVDPSSFDVANGSVVLLNISTMLKMTTKTHVQIVLVLEKEKLYSSINFKLIGKPSQWIDVDEIEMSEDILGQGG